MTYNNEVRVGSKWDGLVECKTDRNILCTEYNSVSGSNQIRKVETAH